MQKLVTMADYGHVEVTLNQVMEERGVTRGALARATGTRFEVVDRWCKGDVDRMDLDVLARLCCVLECQISDILRYDPLPQNGG